MRAQLDHLAVRDHVIAIDRKSLGYLFDLFRNHYLQFTKSFVVFCDHRQT